MSEEHIITHSGFTNFLASGAFLRDGSHVLLLEGPFSSSATDKSQEISVCCPHFYDTQELRFLRPRAVQSVGTSDFARFLLRFLEETTPPASPAPVWDEPAKGDFEKAFARVQNLISEGQIDKAVPAAFARAAVSVTPAMKARWLLELMTAPPEIHPYGWWDGDEGVIGGTPEVLFDVDGKSLSTMALAGTLAKADGRAQDLARSAKDQHEHALVVQDIRNELKFFGRVVAGETSVLELPTLYHLSTPIRAELNEGADVAALVRRLHPTAALGVFPRLFGWRWMAELPGQADRARFGAPFVVRVSPERVVALVAIRNLQWSGGRLLLGSGCGVVKQSDLETEWRELARKRRSVLTLLGMTS